MKPLFLTLMLISGSVFAANHEVKMLDNGTDGNMVFEPAFIKAAPGDTVTFKPANKGHWVESKAVPDGAKNFTSKLDEEFSVKLDKEGVYVYTCPPHRLMNMSAIIQVGKPVNKTAAEAAVNELEKRSMQNKGRLSKLMQQVK